MDYHKKISVLEKKRKQITEEILYLFNREHPIGSVVYFEKWGGEIRADVIQHNNCYERIKVRAGSGKEYWVDFYWILKAGAKEG